MAQLPAILCLHGGGSSASIFEIQTLKLRRALSNHFRFVFVQGPFESPPGPGVLPFFSDLNNFYTWTPTNKAGRADISSSAFANVAENLVAPEDRSQFVGVMAFSLGSLVASHILLENQRSDGAAWPNLRFGVLLNADYYREAFPPFGDAAWGCEGRLCTPTVQVYGWSDPGMEKSVALLKTIFKPRSAKAMGFAGGHHLPQSPVDVQRLAKMVLEVSRQPVEVKRQAPVLGRLVEEKKEVVAEVHVVQAGDIVSC